jgi:hypothetical protein
MANDLNTQINNIGNYYTNASYYHGITNDGRSFWGEGTNRQDSRAGDLKWTHGNNVVGWLGDNLNFMRDKNDYSRHNLNEEMRLKREALKAALTSAINGDEGAKLQLGKLGLDLGTMSVKDAQPQLQALQARIEGLEKRPSMDMDAYSKEGRDQLYSKINGLQTQYTDKLITRENAGNVLYAEDVVLGGYASQEASKLPTTFKGQMEQNIKEINAAYPSGEFSAFAEKLKTGIEKTGESPYAMRTATNDIMDKLNKRVKVLAVGGKSPQDILKEAYEGKQPEILAYIELHKRLTGANVAQSEDQLKAKRLERQRTAGLGLTGAEMKEGNVYRLAQGTEASGKTRVENDITLNEREKLLQRIGKNKVKVQGADGKIYTKETSFKDGVRTTIVTASDGQQTIYTQRQDGDKRGQLFATQVNTKTEDKALKEKQKKARELALAQAKNDKALGTPRSIASASSASTPTPAPTTGTASTPTPARGVTAAEKAKIETQLTALRSQATQAGPRTSKGIEIQNKIKELEAKLNA